MIIKWLAGYFGHSYALIADGIESLSDVFTSLILLVALRIAMKAPDDDHPFGHGKAEPFAAIFVSLALIGASMLIAIESVHKLRTPHELPAAYTLLVLAGVVVIKEMLFRYVVDIGTEANSTAMKADAWHHRSDAITSATAFIGISIALIGGKGYEYADDWAALVASLVIILNAYFIFKPAFAELMDVAPPQEITEAILNVAFSVPEVKGIHKLKVRKMGFEYYADMHLMVDGELTVEKGHAIAHRTKDVILASNPRIVDVLIHLEPYNVNYN